MSGEVIVGGEKINEEDDDEDEDESRFNREDLAGCPWGSVIFRFSPSISVLLNCSCKDRAKGYISLSFSLSLYLLLTL